MIQGLDVAIPQRGFNFAPAPAEGIRFVYIRASEAFGKDSTFDTHLAGARKAEISPGAYHAWYPDQDPIAQAKFFFQVSKGLGTGEGELPPCLDVELFRKRPAGEIVAKLRETVLRVEELFQRTPVIYTGPGFWSALRVATGNKANPWTYPGHEAKDLARCPLWMANYMVNGAWDPTVAPWTRVRPKRLLPWTDWTIWQYSGNGGKRIKGNPVDVDRNVFAGDEQAFSRFCNRPTFQTGPTEPPPLPVATGPDLATVRGVQEALFLLGFDPGPQDGQSGPRTKAAVLAFQRRAGLVADGVVGPRTREALSGHLVAEKMV